MKQIYLCVFFIVASIVSVGQTNISGIVNTYHKVIEIVPSKACLRVADPTGLNVNTLVMVVQMKGATISTANNTTYGDTASLNGAGNYEIGVICYIIGDSVFLFHDLLNTYDTASKVQLVQFGEYFSATVVDTVKAMSWDSVAGLGGVIAIYAEENITLNAPIYADSSGYAGGVYYSNSGTCNIVQSAGTGFVYNITATSNLNGAYKGESVANISSAQNAAKGAPANGGGGGNNHNNSGGGGANLTAGGNGGGNSSGGPTGCNVSNNYGRAGKALSSWAGKKIFMGGGGGAGHSNNGGTAFNYGGNGGGLIFIWANNLIGNNDSISANGGMGGASQSDGAGGGGAGGTIIMHVTNYTGNVTITARGGAGGQSDDGLVGARCFGGGGGGSGGAIYFTGATPTVTITTNGGAGGAEINRDNAGCNTVVSGATGSNGLIFSNYTFFRSMDEAGYCQVLLPSKLLYFKAQLNGHSVIVNWQVDHPELVEKFIVEKRATDNGWSDLVSINAADDRFKYATTDPNPLFGNNFYRLKIIDKDGSNYYSDIRTVRISSLNNDLSIYPNPASDKIFISGKLQPGSPIKLLDMSGRIIWQQTIVNNHSPIMLPKVSRGLYLLQHNGLTRKLVIH
ncbi:MAG: T9SS type A sorting domain-containing protein [Chitinophagaceae bacterium]|nr:T9SS type A sorting domain-containing protein [Chitinophagaceae bacterium]